MHPHAIKVSIGKCMSACSRMLALGPVQLPDHAKAVGLDIAKFTDCLDSGKYTEEVKQDMADARAAGVTGTRPSFWRSPATSRARLRRSRGLSARNRSTHSSLR